MTYLTENPWPLAIAFLLGAAFCAWNASRTQTGIAWKLCGVCLLLAVLPFVTDQLVETDREQVTEHLVELAEAVRSNNTSKVLGFVKGMDGDAHQTVEEGMKRVNIRSLRIKDVRIDASSGEGTSDFRANGSVDVTGIVSDKHVATRWVLDWSRLGDEWKVTKITRLDPLKGEPMGTFDAN